MLGRSLRDRDIERRSLAIVRGELRESGFRRVLAYLTPLERRRHGATAAPGAQLRLADRAREEDIVEEASALEANDLFPHDRHPEPPNLEPLCDLRTRERTPGQHAQCGLMDVTCGACVRRNPGA